MDWTSMVEQFDRLRRSNESSEAALEQTIKLVLQNQADAPTVIQSLLSRHQTSGSRFNTTYLSTAIDNSVSEDVNLPRALLGRLGKWAQTPSSFWNMLDTSRGNPQSQCPITLVYNRLQASKEEHSIIRRLSVMTFYHLLKQVATAAQFKTSTEAVQDLAVERICEERCASSVERKRVKTRVKEYLKAAAVYKRVIDRSDAGMILLLPDKIPPYLWERYLPTRSEMVDSMIRRLRSLAHPQRDYQGHAQMVLDSLLKSVAQLIDGTYVGNVRALSSKLGRKRKQNLEDDELPEGSQERRSSLEGQGLDLCGRRVPLVEPQGPSDSLPRQASHAPLEYIDQSMNLLPAHVRDLGSVQQYFSPNVPSNPLSTQMETMNMLNNQGHNHYPQIQASNFTPSVPSIYGHQDIVPSNLVALHQRPYAFTDYNAPRNIAEMIESIPFHSSFG
ncbi:MAG: hypothetical protein M4579_003487 [Chaenotheca gracillima]|nr:MAG: hypothetical protein M4579_003487 [Chaenotheca gracillima]